MLAAIPLTFLIVIPLLLVTCFGVIFIWGIVGKLAGPRSRGWVFVLPCLVLGLGGVLALLAGSRAGVRSEVRQFARAPRAAIHAQRKALHQLRSTARSTIGELRDSVRQAIGEVADSARVDAEAITSAQMEFDFDGTGNETTELTSAIQVPAPGHPDGMISVQISEPPQARFASRRGSILWSIATAILMAAFLGVGYVFLDASTRGHYTWPLRLASAAAFAALCVAISSIRHQL